MTSLETLCIKVFGLLEEERKTLFQTPTTILTLERDNFRGTDLNNLKKLKQLLLVDCMLYDTTFVSELTSLKILNLYRCHYNTVEMGDQLAKIPKGRLKFNSVW
jgi:hypothetical protein